MEQIPSTAKAARDAARKIRDQEREDTRVKIAAAQEAARMNMELTSREFDRLSKAVTAERDRVRRSAALWRALALASLVTLASSAAYLSLRDDPAAHPWSTKGTPPPIQRVKVITTGFVTKKGQWCSFDNGEPITVTDWKP